MATKTFTGATDHNWSTSNNWSPSGQPASTDNAVFNSSSPACTVTSGAVCASVDFSGGGSSNYANTITFTNALTVSGNVTLPTAATATFTGSGALIINASATLTSNGQSCNVPLTLSGTSLTFTFTGNWTTTAALVLTITTAMTITGTGTLQAGSHTASGSTPSITLGTNVIITGTQNMGSVATSWTINGASYTWTAQSGLTSVSCILAGTATLIISGGSTAFSGSYAVNCNLTFSGTMTITGTLLFASSGTPTFNCSSANITTTGSTLQLGGSCTINATGMTGGFNNFTSTSSSYVISGTGLSIYGNLVGSVTGTSTVTLLAGATINTGSTININITIAGNITVSSNNFHFGGTNNPLLTWTSGTVTWTMRG